MPALSGDFLQGITPMVEQIGKELYVSPRIPVNQYVKPEKKPESGVY